MARGKASKARGKLPHLPDGANVVLAIEGYKITGSYDRSMSLEDAASHFIDRVNREDIETIFLINVDLPQSTNCARDIIDNTINGAKAISDDVAPSGKALLAEKNAVPFAYSRAWSPVLKEHSYCFVLDGVATLYVAGKIYEPNNS